MNNFSKKQKSILALIIAAFGGIALYITLTNVKKPQPIVKKPKRIEQAIKKRVYKPRATKKGVFPEQVRGEIVSLKKFSIKYAFDFYKMFSPTVRKHLEFPEKMTFGEVTMDIKLEIDAMKKGHSIAYTIWDNKDEKLIGSIKITERSTEHYSGYHGQLAMWLNENYWGGGRIQEAIKLISKTYFEVYPRAENYTAHARTWNPRSFRTLEKAGFKRVSEFSEDGKVTQYRYELSRDTVIQRD